MSKDIKKDTNKRTLSNPTEKIDGARDDYGGDQNKRSGVQEESEAANERDRLSAWLKEQREKQGKLKDTATSTTAKQKEEDFSMTVSDKDNLEHSSSKAPGQKRFTKAYWEGIQAKLRKAGSKHSPELGKNAKATIFMRDPKPVSPKQTENEAD